jgi:kinesin family protein C2/C3
MKGKIRVYARIRPLTSTERGNGCDMAVTCEDDFSCTLVNRGRAKLFEFDRVFSPASTQAEVFEDTKRLVQSAVDGYNVCIFA